MTALQTIIKEAKVIWKKHPKLSWQEAIKKASTMYKSKHKPKKSGKAIAGKRIVKKSATKKVATKKSTHKDTKSHNVNIRVVSGTNGSEQFVKQLNSLLSDKKKLESDLNIYKQRKKENVPFHPFNALHFKRLPSMIKSINIQIREAKKHIK
jgi:hypothetical protein